MEKAFKLPQIKAEDEKALSTFSLFLVGCRNVMKDIDDTEEMDNPTNMRAIITELPFKIRGSGGLMLVTSRRGIKEQGSQSWWILLIAKQSTCLNHF